MGSRRPEIPKPIARSLGPAEKTRWLRLDRSHFVAAGDLDSPHEKQNQEHDQDDTDKTHSAVSITIAVAAESAAEATEEKDHKDDDENEPKRHALPLSFGPTKDGYLVSSTRLTECSAHRVWHGA
jgi:hypothetical protein